jgi:hypothetical protein
LSRPSTSLPHQRKHKAGHDELSIEVVGITPPRFALRERPNARGIDVLLVFDKAASIDVDRDLVRVHLVQRPASCKPRDRWLGRLFLRTTAFDVIPAGRDGVAAGQVFV